jgi:hypothetical protein
MLHASQTYTRAHKYQQAKNMYFGDSNQYPICHQGVETFEHVLCCNHPTTAQFRNEQTLEHRLKSNYDQPQCWLWSVDEAREVVALHDRMQEHSRQFSPETLLILLDLINPRNTTLTLLRLA